MIQMKIHRDAILLLGPNFHWEYMSLFYTKSAVYLIVRYAASEKSEEDFQRLVNNMIASLNMEYTFHKNLLKLFFVCFWFRFLYGLLGYSFIVFSCQYHSPPTSSVQDD